MRPPRSSILIAGAVYLAAMIVIAATETRLGAPIYLVCSAVAAAAYLAVLAVVWRAPDLSHRSAFFLALALAVAFRVPLAFEPINAGNDMFRYIWDGRVQRLGYNPYAVLPADPALASAHPDDNTRLMPSRHSRTPYPPAAQLFFRFVVTVHDSVGAMKAALILCDLLTMFALWRWLLATGRSEWLAVAYAWNPLSVLEVSHSGHIDALCALWITVCAYLLARRRTAWAAAALALAIATKLLPIVLIPILWRRIRIRDAFIGVGLIAALSLPFATGSNPFGALVNVVESTRFNGPLFRAVAVIGSPRIAAAIAVVLGLLAAIVCRRKLPADNPAAWAWPMAVALAWAPVIYPWYLLSMTPFLLVPATLPLIAWTLIVPAVYVVWEIAWAGGRWIVPPAVLVLEYGSVAAAALASSWWMRRRRAR